MKLGAETVGTVYPCSVSSDDDDKVVIMHDNYIQSKPKILRKY